MFSRRARQLGEGEVDNRRWLLAQARFTDDPLSSSPLSSKKNREFAAVARREIGVHHSAYAHTRCGSEGKCACRPFDEIDEWGAVGLAREGRRWRP